MLPLVIALFALSLGALIYVLISRGYFSLMTFKSISKTPAETTESSVAPPVFDYQAAYSIALAEAVIWDEKSALAKSTETDFGWSYIFVTETKKDRGYRVEIANGKVVSSEEGAYSGLGGALPSDLVTKEEAIAKVQAIPGYENAQISGIEMIYGPDGKQWYWGVKTERGTVSIKATK